MQQTDRQMTDDRQTDHDTEKCVRIGVIACGEEAIPPNNNTTGVVRNFFTVNNIHQVPWWCSS